MFNPGAAVEDWSYDSGVLSRTTRVRLVSSIGSRVSELGVVESRLTPTGFGDAGGGPFHPMVVRETGDTFDLASHLARLGDGTVATIELVWSDPISLEAAGALARSPHDVRVVWLGFAVDDSSGYSGPGFDPGGVLGGPACDDSQLPNEISSRGGGAGSGNAFVSEPSAERAWRHVEDVLDELLEHPEFIESLGRGWSRDAVEQAARFLDEQRVRTMVVTGPTTELLEFVESAGSDFGGVRDVDFYNWFTPICGR